MSFQITTYRSYSSDRCWSFAIVPIVTLHASRDWSSNVLVGTGKNTDVQLYYLTVGWLIWQVSFKVRKAAISLHNSVN
jgi:hypothetical protein